MKIVYSIYGTNTINQHEMQQKVKTIYRNVVKIEMRCCRNMGGSRGGTGGADPPLYWHITICFLRNTGTDSLGPIVSRGRFVSPGPL